MTQENSRRRGGEVLDVLYSVLLLGWGWERVQGAAGHELLGYLFLDARVFDDVCDPVREKRLLRIAGSSYTKFPDTTLTGN